MSEETSLPIQKPVELSAFEATALLGSNIRGAFHGRRLAYPAAVEDLWQKNKSSTTNVGSLLQAVLKEKSAEAPLKSSTEQAIKDYGVSLTENISEDRNNVFASSYKLGCKYMQQVNDLLEAKHYRLEKAANKITGFDAGFKTYNLNGVARLVEINGRLKENNQPLIGLYS